MSVKDSLRRSMLETASRVQSFATKLKSLFLAPIKSLTRCSASSTVTLSSSLPDASQKRNEKSLGSTLEKKKQPESQPKNLKLWSKKMLHQELIQKAAKKHLINPNLVLAIVSVESSFNTEAVRYESHYKWIYKPEGFARDLKISLDTEVELQKFSYGLMQCMGAVARENGYTGSLFRLCKPDLGLEYGCLHFAKYFRKYNDLGRTLAAYNGGPGAINANGTVKNQAYVDKVMDRYTKGYGVV